MARLKFAEKKYTRGEMLTLDSNGMGDDIYEDDEKI